MQHWCADNLADRYADDLDSECRALVRELGAAGFLKLSVADAKHRPDVRSLAIARETLAYHCGARRFRLRDAGAGLGRDLAVRNGRAEARLAAEGRERARRSPPSP